MNTPMNPEPRRPLRTSDLAAASAPQTEHDEVRDGPDVQTQSSAARQMASESASPRSRPESEQLEPLFASDAAARYRTRWAEVQSSFVDDPQRAVADGDELVAEVMQSLAESFTHEREKLEDELSHTGEVPTEALRVGLRRYRSFFERLLSL